jgi:hypothetical protein
MADVADIVSTNLWLLGVVLTPEQLTALVSCVLFRVEDELVAAQSRYHERLREPNTN